MNKAIPAVFFPLAVITLAVVAIPGINFAAADFNDPNSCATRDCVPPVLGYHTKNRAFIEGGFTINGETFDVPQRILNVEQPFNPAVGEQITINLVIFENKGARYLEHSLLKIGDSSINWHKKFNQEVSTDVTDKAGLFSNVNVRASSIDEYTHEVSYSFRINEKLEPTTVEITTWDFDRNVARYYFHNALGVGQTAEEDESTQVESFCAKGLNLYFKVYNDNPVCLTEASAEKLLARNWAYP